MPGKHSIEFMHNEWTTLSISLFLILFSMLSMLPPSSSTIYFVLFFWLGLSYVKCIKTIAQAEEPQSVFIYEAQLEEAEKELKPQQGFGYGLRPALWLGSYSGLNLSFFGFGRERCVVLLSNCSSTTPTKNNK